MQNEQSGSTVPTKTYSITASWKCSDWFPTKTSACCTALAFLATVALFIIGFDALFGLGFSGGTAELGLVRMYLPVFGIAAFGFAINCHVLFIRRHKSEKKLAVIAIVIILGGCATHH